MNIVLHGERMLSRQAAHAEIKAQLELPDYYGNNLDALWDTLTTMRADVTLQHAGAMLHALGSYGCDLLKTFYDADQECPYFSFDVASDIEKPEVDSQNYQ